MENCNLYINSYSKIFQLVIVVTIFKGLVFTLTRRVHAILSCQTQRLGSLMTRESGEDLDPVPIEASGRGLCVSSQIAAALVSQVARHPHNCFEIGTSFSQRRSLNIFWTQCCFWHLSALYREGAAGFRLQAARDLLSWRVSGSAVVSVGPRTRLSTMSSRNLIIASLLISGQTFAAPPAKGNLKLPITFNFA